MCADMQSFVPGLRLENNAHVLLRFHGGACGVFWSSQEAAGNQNALRQRTFGAKGELESTKETQNPLW